MLAFIYIILSMFLGTLIISVLLKTGCRLLHKNNNLWIMIPASFGIGILCLTWAVYIVSWFFSVCARVDNPLAYGNTICMVIAFLALILGGNFRKAQLHSICKNLVLDKNRIKKETIFYVLLAIFILTTMFYVFFVSDGAMYSGFTVYGDYAPHTAMMRSFSLGNNFPTQYPHFGGEDVKYHFMFQFLVGNLEYLGMRIDFAYNILSAFSLWGFLVFLTRFSLRFSGSLWAGVFAVLCFIFRSGTAFFQFVYEHIKANDLWVTLKENISFIGYTPNENWGLWNYNVYINQRHLGFGLLIIAIVIWIFTEWLEMGTEHQEHGIQWLKKRFFSWEAWKSYNIAAALLCGTILGLCSFWNGAAVIGGLLILCGFALFSDGKIDYAVMAGITIVLTQLQSKIFVNGSVANAKFFWGFICTDKTILGVLYYIFQITGIFLVGLLIILLFMNRIKRCMILASILPIVFAFTISLTPDVTVNHKYIMIAYAFLTVFWGDVLWKLFSGKGLKKIAAVILTICLTITGAYEFTLICRGNDSKHRVVVNLESDLLKWFADTMNKDDLVLTAEYSMNDITMSGVMMYCGWPYYAWSAGYNTYYRADIGKRIYSTTDEQELKSLVEQEKITYIVFEENMTFEGIDCNEKLIQETYPLVKISNDERIRVYKTDI